MTEAIDEIRAALADMGLVDADAHYPLSALGGGVSCDVYLADLPGRHIVVKRALPKLRVAADWRAPPERSEAEVAWIRLVAGIDPKRVPGILGEDHKRHIFAMEYLPPEQFPLWKTLLADGRVDAGFAARVGTELAGIHAATAGREDVAAAFDNRTQFQALRIEPYLLFTAKQSGCRAAIRADRGWACESRIALMQGDISPRTFSAARMARFPDAETACYGDPVFDLASVSIICC